MDRLLSLQSVDSSSTECLFLCSDVGFGAAGNSANCHHTVKSHRVALVHFCLHGNETESSRN